MRKNYIVLADAAEVTSSGKFALVGGGINAVGVPSFPTPLIMAAVIGLIVEPEECGRLHVGQIDLVGPEGRGTPGPNFAFTPALNPPEERDLPIEFRVVANLTGTMVAAPGRYAVHLKVDSRDVADASFLVYQGAFDTTARNTQRGIADTTVEG